MPTLRPCAVFGCDQYTTRRLCRDHAAAAEHERNLAPHRAIYGTWAWRHARLRRFAEDDWTCVDCGWRDDTESGEGLHGDHDPDLLVLLDRHLDPFAVEHIRTRCHSCHSKKTAATTIVPRGDA